MDIVQILNINIPVKANKITNKENKMRNILKEYALRYLKQSCNYFSQGVLYPNTIEVLDWKAGIKSGSILGDEMIFNTSIKGCFRMYPINTIHTGIITEINPSQIKINNEYMYNITVPIVKLAEKLEINLHNNQIIEGSQNNYPYISNKVNFNDLNVGDTVKFLIIDLSSKFNNNDISVIGFLTEKVDYYCKNYETIFNKKDTLHYNNITLRNNTRNNRNNLFEFIMPKYYMDQDIHPVITEEDFPYKSFSKMDKTDIMGNHFCMYYYKNANIDNLIKNLKTGDVLLYEIENEDTIKTYENIMKHFANINVYYWKEDDRTITFIVGSYKV